MNNESCGNCRFWGDDPGHDAANCGEICEGPCRRYPPVLHGKVASAMAEEASEKAHGQTRGVHSSFYWEASIGQFPWRQPVTLCSQWCGEWQSSEQKFVGELRKHLHPDCGLSVRCRNIIHRAISEEGDIPLLLTWGVDDWHGVKNCGDKAAAEIVKWLERLRSA